MVSLNLINLALSLMVLQIVVLIGPAVTLGLLSSSDKLMGRHTLRGAGLIIYWIFLFLIFATGVTSVVFMLR